MDMHLGRDVGQGVNGLDAIALLCLHQPEAKASSRKSYEPVVECWSTKSS